jgi:hypothetical protein
MKRKTAVRFGAAQPIPGREQSQERFAPLPASDSWRGSGARAHFALVLLALGATLVACSDGGSSNGAENGEPMEAGAMQGSECEEAGEKLAECAGLSEGSGGRGEFDCTGAAKCISDCVNEAPCEQINDAEGTPYGGCLISCSE